MVEEVGNDVVALRRIGFGSLRLEGLAEGASRPLTRSELRGSGRMPGRWTRSADRR